MGHWWQRRLSHTHTAMKQIAGPSNKRVVVRNIRCIRNCYIHITMLTIGFAYCVCVHTSTHIYIRVYVTEIIESDDLFSSRSLSIAFKIEGTTIAWLRRARCWELMNKIFISLSLSREFLIKLSTVVIWFLIYLFVNFLRKNRMTWLVYGYVLRRE